MLFERVLRDGLTVGYCVGGRTAGNLQNVSSGQLRRGVSVYVGVENSLGRNVHNYRVYRIVSACVRGVGAPGQNRRMNCGNRKKETNSGQTLTE